MLAGVAILIAAIGCSNNKNDKSLMQDNLPMAPDFVFEAYQGEDEIGGKELSLSDVITLGKPIILNFWAARCPPCQIEMPEFQEYYNKHLKKVLMIGVDVGYLTGLGLPEEAMALLQALEISYPTVTTADTGIAEAYELLGLPGTFFINSSGRIIESWTGLLTKEKLGELAGMLIDSER